MAAVLAFPRTDTGLLQWSQNFLDFITATPTDFGLVAADATAYLAVHTAYSDALAACDPAIRNKPAVVTKNAAKAGLKAAATLLANKIYSTASVTTAQKVELGIPPRQSPSAIPAPTTAPVLEVLSALAWTVQIRLRAATGTGRGREPGTIGASIFSYVGATAPADIASWKFEGSAGRVGKINITFPETLAAGTKVWLTSFWFNGRKESGPATPPVAVNLPGGSVSLAA